MNRDIVNLTLVWQTGPHEKANTQLLQLTLSNLNQQLTCPIPTNSAQSYQKPLQRA
jgi:hypothetical protein